MQFVAKRSRPCSPDHSVVASENALRPPASCRGAATEDSQRTFRVAVRAQPCKQCDHRLAPAVYSAPMFSPAVQRLLLTHARRNSVGTLPKQAVVVVPAAEQDLFIEPERFWSALEGGRFHDY